jgi:hypothetical protein
VIPINNREFKLGIHNKLLQIQSCKIISEIQLALRCPICGDSKKDPNKTRFYVKIDINNDNQPIVFNCFNCNNSGILTPSLLRSFKINDLQLNSNLIQYNKQTMGNINKSLGIKNNDFNFIIPIPKEDEKTIRKLNYINNRMKLKLTIEELVKLKTIFNLGEFLRVNDINSITVSKDRASLLHNEYVGFLTAKQEFINFRDVTDKNKRYDKYSVFKNLDNTKKFYTIPNNIDLLTPKNITINIAEGVFDILGIYYHIFEKETYNTVYTAVCGSGYITVLKYFIQSGLFGNVDINIFSDNDHEPYFYKELKNELKDWINKIDLYYNQKNKDYGVSKDKIELIRKKI